MKKTSVTTGRFLIPTTTAPTAPVSIVLNPINPGLIRLQMYLIAATGTGHDFNTIGWRMKNNGVVLIPGDGSKDDGFTFSAGATNWAAIPAEAVRIDLDLTGLVLSGPPFNVTFEFYNEENHDHEVAIFLQVCDPVHDIDDLIKEMQADRARLGRIEAILNRNEKLINPGQ